MKTPEETQLIETSTSANLGPNEYRREADIQNIFSLGKRELKALSQHCVSCTLDDISCPHPLCKQGKRLMIRNALSTEKSRPLYVCDMRKKSNVLARLFTREKKVMPYSWWH